MRPRAARIVVDLPEPFGPTSPVTNPWWTVNDKLSTAVTGPKRLVRRSTISESHGFDGTDHDASPNPPSEPTTPVPAGVTSFRRRSATMAAMPATDRVKALVTGRDVGYPFGTRQLWVGSSGGAAGAGGRRVDPPRGG